MWLNLWWNAQQLIFATAFLYMFKWSFSNTYITFFICKNRFKNKAFLDFWSELS